jgi:hypothetical protein
VAAETNECGLRLLGVKARSVTRSSSTVARAAWERSPCR